jgi:hypothetical protein
MEARREEEPMPATAEIMRMSPSDKLADAMRRSVPLLPAEGQAMVLAMLRPESIALTGGTLIAWAGSHAFGAGEIVDVLLLSIGFIALGFSVFEGATEFAEFVTVASSAHSDLELQRAAQHFARAVTILGISAVQMLLLQGRGQAAIARGRPQIRPRVRVAEPPATGSGLNLTRPSAIGDGVLGRTGTYGAIEVSRDQTITEQRVTLMHELVHRYFSPRTGPLRKLRAEANISLYTRSALLRYLEEALAEGYAQLKIHGVMPALRAYRFPLRTGYVTISQVGAEGQAIGAITVGGVLLHVSISQGTLDASHSQ